MENTENTPSEQKNSEPKGQFHALPLAFELGYLVAVPLVGLALLGRFADKLFGTSPWLLVAGIVMATTLSSWIIYKKVKNILNN